MGKVIKPVGYTVKSGDMYLTKYKRSFFHLRDGLDNVEFNKLSEGFRLINFKDDAKEIAKQCNGEVVEVFMLNEGGAADNED